MSRRTLAAAALAVAAVLVLPSTALAHGLVGRTDLPIPTWLFGWAAAIVLAASFVALGALWREPRLQDPRERRLFRMPAILDVVCGVLGIAAFVAVVYSGVKGVQQATANLAPTSIYVIFWVGIPVLSLLFGDLFRVFSPWRSLAEGLRFAARGRGWRTLAYPDWLGRWPAALGIAAFAWVELALDPSTKTDPSVLAWMAVAYAVTQLIGMAVFGIETWSERADAFGVYFNLYSRLSVFERRDRVLYLRPLLSGAPRWTVLAGSIPLLAVAIGSTTFDGFSNGPVWASLGPDLTDLFGGGTLGGELANTVGLIGGILLVGGFYRLGVKGMTTVGHHEHDSRELAGLFVHTLIPIAFAYALAHYFSLLAYQGQAMGYLISDPLGNGSNLFGTADKGIDYGVISSTGIWYVQVAALVCGHVAGLVLAHDRALAIYPRPQDATRSQYWMLVVMVGFTSLGLWLLSVIGAR